MELWEVLDENGNKTGQIMEKNDESFFEKGFCHLGAEVWIINSENKLLIQKRAPQKTIAPNLWAMIGGSVILGESSRHALIRELKEELNIDIDINKLKFITKFKVDSLWVDTYILKADFDINKMILKKDEVSDVKWMSIDEITILVKNNDFFPKRWEYVSEILKKLILERNK